MIEELYDIYADNERHVCTSRSAPDNLRTHIQSWQVLISKLGCSAAARRTHHPLLPLYRRVFCQLGTAINRRLPVGPHGAVSHLMGTPSPRLFWSSRVGRTAEGSIVRSRRAMRSVCPCEASAPVVWRERCGASPEHKLSSWNSKVSGTSCGYNRSTNG